MENYYRYFIIASVSITILYFAYLLLFRTESNFRLLRIFLVSSVVFSLLLPFNNYSVDIQLFNKTPNTSNSSDHQVNTDAQETSEIPVATQQVTENKHQSQNLQTKPVDYSGYWIIIHLLISGILIFRVLLSFGKMLYFYSTSTKKKQNKYTIILLDKRIVPFSFFNWIFIDKQDENKGLEQIIAHEKAHANQNHTLDLLLFELMAATMWFNPFAWMLKKALKQVHEYLADEKVLDTGFNKLDYQALLVNQAAEERLVAVSSNFSYSSIKKRIIMMSKSKTHGRAGSKFFALLSIALVLTFSVSCLNGQENANNELIAAVSPTKMNVLYIGVDNPVSIAVTGAQKDKIKASIDNGTITGESGNYIVRVKGGHGKIATITVTVDGKVVSQSQFRIKSVPDPVPIIRGNWNKTTFTKKELIDAGGLEVFLVNFDFDLKFEVVSFVVAAAFDGHAEDAKQHNGGDFAKHQIELIKKVPSGTKVYIEDIKAKGPDGVIRSLPPIKIEIK